MAFDAQDGERTGYWSAIWSSEAGKSVYKHNENIPLNRTYELLTALGYEMADDEKALQEGTHRLLRCMAPAARRTRPAISAKLLTLNATSAAKLAMTTAMRSSCAERSMANDRPCKV